MKCTEEIDAKILRELLYDGRKSFTSLAREFQTSKEAIWKRYNDMKKAGIITGSTIQFNYRFFGYQGVATILLNVNYEDLTDVFEKLSKVPNLYPVRAYNSSFNIVMTTTIKDLRDLDKTQMEIRRYPINSFRSFLWGDVKHMPENLDFGFKQHSIVENIEISPGSENDLKVDKIDLKIVDHLMQNGRSSFSKIGESLGISSDTVARRYNRMYKNNFIKTSIQVNPKYFGYKGTLTTFISFSSLSHVQTAIKKLMRTPNVFIIVKQTGEYDLHVVSAVRCFEDIIEKNEKITSMPGVIKIEACLRPMIAPMPGKGRYISTF